MLGPFKVLKAISPTAVRLLLPKNWRIYNTFHTSLIEPHRETVNQPRVDPKRVLKEAEEITPDKYVIDRIVDSKVVGGAVQYLVKWEGWPQRRH